MGDPLVDEEFKSSKEARPPKSTHDSVKTLNQFFFFETKKFLVSIFILFSKPKSERNLFLWNRMVLLNVSKNAQKRGQKLITGVLVSGQGPADCSDCPLNGLEKFC